MSESVNFVTVTPCGVPCAVTWPATPWTLALISPFIPSTSPTPLLSTAEPKIRHVISLYAEVSGWITTRNGYMNWGFHTPQRTNWAILDSEAVND